MTSIYSCSCMCCGTRCTAKNVLDREATNSYPWWYCLPLWAVLTNIFRFSSRWKGTPFELSSLPRVEIVVGHLFRPIALPLPPELGICNRTLKASTSSSDESQLLLADSTAVIFGTSSSSLSSFRPSLSLRSDGRSCKYASACSAVYLRNHCDSLWHFTNKNVHFYKPVSTYFKRQQ